MKLKEWIQKDLLNSVGNLNQRKINSLEKTNSEMFTELTEKSKEFDLDNLREAISWILNDITEHPICLNCGSRLKYNNNIHNPYPKFCSSSCSNTSNETKKLKEESFMTKYGSKSPFQIPEVLQKTKEKHLKQYGVENPFQAEEVKEKMRETWRQKYGVEWSSQAKKVKEKYNHNKIQKKIYETKKKNGSLNSSKTEDKLYELLIEKFPDTIRQYKSVDYPWACDFYIPKENLYIEYLGTWTHGNKPYNAADDECVELVEKMKRKSEELNFRGEKKKFYLNAISTWTKLDVMKRTHAKENKLNYLEFFKESQFEEWFNSL